MHKDQCRWWSWIPQTKGKSLDGQIGKHGYGGPNSRWPSKGTLSQDVYSWKWRDHSTSSIESWADLHQKDYPSMRRKLGGQKELYFLRRKGSQMEFMESMREQMHCMYIRNKGNLLTAALNGTPWATTVAAVSKCCNCTHRVPECPTRCRTDTLPNQDLPQNAACPKLHDHTPSKEHKQETFKKDMTRIAHIYSKKSSMI